MNKKKKNMIVLLACLAGLGAAYGIITVVNNVIDEKKKEEAAAEEEANTFYLCQMDQPEKIKVTSADDSYEFSYNDDDETWSNDDDEHFPVSQSSFSSVASALKSLKAERKLDGADSDLSLYGLDEPQYTISISDESSAVNIKIGAVNNYGDVYYAMTDAGDDIYTVSSSLITNIDHTAMDFLEKESFPSIAVSNIYGIDVNTKDSETVFTKQEEADEEASSEEISAEETSAEETSAEEASSEEASTEEATTEAPEPVWTVSFKAADKEVTQSDMSDMLTAITTLSFTDCEDYYADEDELEKYGFASDDDITQITVNYTSGDETKEVTLKIGSKSEDESSYYVMMDDSSAVNTISADSIESVLTAAENIQ